ncbi:MAG: DNA primase [Rhodospirillaceae bacterium]|nr:DNA primase [Rhodospirillaceae bacterium]
MAIPSNFLDEIRARIGLADVVGRRVRLTKKGHEHSGLCPFHKEKTPSFTLNEGKGFYHCFGCGAHGTVFDFLMQTEGLNFREAVEKLAGEAGLVVPQERPEDRAREERKKTLYDATEAAAQYYASKLYAPEGRDALDYLRGRGLSAETIKEFNIGYAPDVRDGIKNDLAGKNGISTEMLLGSGLIIQPDDKSREPYDRFRGRVMFPILDRRDRVVAFGGRILPGLETDKTAKYLNSPETDLFHKGNMLYAMEKAQSAARGGQALVVAEGYMDVIALHQAGFSGAVAPLGTALTEEQMRELWKIVPEPVLCFDGDNAGQRAMARAAERALSLIRPGFGLRFAILPPGEDPDTLIKNHGAKAFADVLAGANPLSEILWQMETIGADTATPEGLASLQKRLEDHARAIEDPTLRSHFLSSFKDRIWAVRSQGRAQNTKQGGAFGPKGRAGGFKTGGWVKPSLKKRGVHGVFAPGEGVNAIKQAKVPTGHMLEEAIIGNLINHPEIFDSVCERLGSITFLASDLDNLRQEALKTLAGEQGLDVGGLKDHLRHNGYAEILDELLGSKRLMNASIMREDAQTEAALESWEEAYAKYRQSDLRAEILEAQQQLAAENTVEASEKLHILKTQEYGAVTKNAK